MRRKMNIEEYKKLLSNKSDDHISQRLRDTLEDIKFLESIYMGEGNWYHLSETFRDAAHRERQELCQLSSACHSIIRDRMITQRKHYPGSRI